MESLTTGFPPPPSPRLLWTSSPVYGVVHPSNCRTCREYMVHLAEASRADDDPSFNVALKERDFQRNSYYLNGICEGRRLQREHSQSWVAHLDSCRAERDAALETANEHFMNLCAVQEDLRKLKEEYRALQDLFEEVAEVTARGPSPTSSWSPSIDPWVLEESLYDAQHHGIEDGFASNPLIERHDPPGPNVAQIPTPPGSAAGSLPRRTVELPSLIDNTYSEHTSARPAETSEPPPHPYPSPSPSVIEVEPQPEIAPTLVEGEDRVSRRRRRRPAPKTVAELQAIMNEAYAGNESALAHINLMYTEAHATPRLEKSFIQQFLLCYWKGHPDHGRPTPVRSDSTPAPVDENSASASSAVLEIFVDSAPSWGIGFVKDGCWLAWKFRHGWNTEGRDNSWGEMVAVELGLRATIAAGHHSRTITVRSDNAGVVRSLVTGVSKNFQQNLILQKVLQLSRTYNVRIVPKWVSTKLNPADKPSRGVFASRALLFPDPPPLPAHLVDFLHPSVEYRALPS